MRTYKAKCTGGFVWEGQFRRPGDVIELSKENLAKLCQANVVVQSAVETMATQPPENRIARRGGRHANKKL